MRNYLLFIDIYGAATMGKTLWVPEPQWGRAGPFRPVLPFHGLVLAQGRAGTAHHSAVIIAKGHWVFGVFPHWADG